MPKRRKTISPDTIVLLKQIGIGLVVFSTLAILITSIWYGTRVQSFTISDIQVSGGETIKHDAIVSIVESNLDGTYLGLIPKRFYLTYPKQNIIAALDEVERVYNISLNREGGDTLLVSFSEYRPQALWCQSTDGDSCLFLDNTGYAFGVAPNLSGGSLVRFSAPGRETELRTNFVDEVVYQKMFELIDELNEIDWYVTQIEIDQVGDGFVLLNGDSELKINTDNSSEEIVANLLTVLASEEFSHLEPGNFQYIDLRYGNKVFVNEEELVLETEMATSSATTTANSLQADDDL